MCDRLRADGVEDLFRRKTGLLLDPYFSGTKLAWILDNVDGARTRAEAGELAFGTVDSWLAYRLSGAALHITDPSNASRTLLYDLEAQTWDEELLGILSVPAAMLPEIRRSSEIYGTADRDSGLAGRPLAGIVGDQQAATIGQLCTRTGQAKNTYGTGCFLLMNTGERPRPSGNRLLTTVGWHVGENPIHCLEGSVFTAGAAIQWLRDGLGLISSAAEVEPLAGSVPDSGGVVFVPALTGRGAPHWDAYARGATLGLTRGTTSAHLARAALEGIAFSVVDLVHAMEGDAGQTIDSLRVDGGAAANSLLLQIQSDLLQRPVTRPANLETTALGAAYMAGLATGVYESLEALGQPTTADRFEPQIDAGRAAALHDRWLEGVERAKGWTAPDDAG
jgi:glycerol kinase